MRRQSVLGGASPAGSGRGLRLDPPALPVRFTACDAAADGRVRQIEIDRDRVLVRRLVRGMTMRVSLPLDAFLGVSVRLAECDLVEGGSVAVRLEHRDPALTVELHAGLDEPEAFAKWELWAEALQVPLLVADQAGRLHTPGAKLGAVLARAVEPRRRRRNTNTRRRPTLPLRRKAGDATQEMPVHREREIIARH